MKITKELIEKYNLNLCSPQEKKAIEEWMELKVLDGELDQPVDGIDQLEGTIWQSLQNSIQENSQRRRKFPFGTPFFNMAIAASVTIVALITAWVWWYNNSLSNSVTLSNGNTTISKQLETKGLVIEMAPRSTADITTTASQTRGKINFCGAMSIETKKDVELTLNSTCKNGETHSERMTLKKGETYFAFNYRFVSEDELLVVNSKDVADLPPALRRQFANLF